MGPRLPRITAVELLRALKRDGWQPIRQSGSHIILQHSTKLGRVAVPRHSHVIIKLKTLASICFQREVAE
jgi:predicted RNA binding protein YcfA (HicA-like mRNA interferase family)